MRSDGRRISFFASIVKIISAAIEENRYIHAQRRGKRSVVVFEDIDISIMVEKNVDGARVPLPLLIRKTNTKSPEEIDAEIRAAQDHAVKDVSDYVLSEHPLPRWLMRVYYALPRSIRVFLMRRILANPHRMKSMMGTAIVTTVGAPGRVAGWIIPKAMHSLCFAVGPITKKPWVVANRVEIRDILHLTVLVDHDVVDGMPAARFISKLVGRIQRGG